MYYDNMNDLLAEIEHWVAEAEKSFNERQTGEWAKALGASMGCMANIKSAVGAYKRFQKIKETGKC